MSTIKLIGKSTLGELGFCQSTSTMNGKYLSQLHKIYQSVPEQHKVLMTSMTSFENREEMHDAYLPQIRLYDPALKEMFDPECIYRHCLEGTDLFRPIADFIAYCPSQNERVVLSTFSREAPILAFESQNGSICLGTILRRALIEHGDYLFRNIKKLLGGEKVTVTLVTCNHYLYPEGSIPDMVKSLAQKYHMDYKEGVDSQKDKECYHRGEKGNHVVIMW